MGIVIFVPVPQLKQFQKIQTRLVRELEKKFSGKHVVFIAQRRILAKPTRKTNKLKQKRPRSRTLQAVHTAILDDLVYPAETVGKRIRIRLDGSRLFKVHLDETQQTNIEHKTETFASVYKKLTGKVVWDLEVMAWEIGLWDLERTAWDLVMAWRMAWNMKTMRCRCNGTKRQ